MDEEAMSNTTQVDKPRAMGRPVGSNREDTLARILPAARELFATQGYSKTTFKDVGKAVGMTHAALYGYFPSKASLFQATCEHAQELMLAEYAVALEEEKTLRGQIRQILRSSAIAHDRDPSITGLLGSIPLEIRRHPELAELLIDQQNATMQLLTRAFATAQQRGEISQRAKPEQLVIAVLGAAMGIGLLQFGLQRSKLQDSMEVFIDLLEARLFS
jgi:AcrR family transcriptional regulator